MARPRWPTARAGAVAGLLLLAVAAAAEEAASQADSVCAEGCTKRG